MTKIQDQVEDILNTLVDIMNCGLLDKGLQKEVQLVVDKVRSELGSFSVSIESKEVQTLVYVVDGVAFPHYTLATIIKWLDRKGNEWRKLRDLYYSGTHHEIGATLEMLRVLKVIERPDETTEEGIYRKGPRWVAFCRACKFEIEETHS